MEKTRKRIRINLSEPGMHLDFIPYGNLPEVSLVFDDGTHRHIGIIASRKDLLILKDALKDVV
jgi:hypothetical protein